ncbi:hypothetical protein [Lewinella sp. W8]|uniref:hypothetical protein n=1 Tax=Lewinella sp. W8 TaxID=2528208 RepID=UPI001068A9FA|nr:hypothetical protein [Lewinella sp. W8]MTB50836.1 hypothetical protein [Lewinella sp. W8]
MKIMYLANVLVAGWISVSCLFSPKTAQQTVFTDAFAYSESFRLVGALWFAIFVLSALGLFYPRQMALVLVLQLIYKGTWLVVAAAPAIMKEDSYPKGMAMFFLVWVLVLPFVIPWREVFG